MGMSSAMLMLGERDMGGSVYLQWRISRFQFASLARFRFRKEMEGMAGRFVKRQTAVGKNMPPLTAALRRDAGSCGTAGAGHRYASEPEPFRAADVAFFVRKPDDTTCELMSLQCCRYPRTGVPPLAVTMQEP